MVNLLEFALIGGAIWGLFIMMHALQQRFAPGLASSCGWGQWFEPETAGADSSTANDSSNRRQRDQAEEIRRLQERIEVLEAIVTDRRYQFDEDLRRSDNRNS